MDEKRDLFECEDPLCADAIVGALSGEAQGLKLELHGRVDSTNSIARLRAESGAEEGLVICAASQSDGRGRMGRHFFSPDETGLYMSVLLRPGFSPSLSSMITVAAAVAVTDAISEVLGIKSAIKWVNDVFVDGKKVCGILTEAAFSSDGTMDYAVLGIGVNVYQPSEGFPTEIRDVASALLSAPEEGTRSRLCGCILKHFFRYYRDLGSLEFLGEYRRRSIVIGKEVSVLSLSGEEKARALALGIDDSGNLLLRFPDGEERALSSGEIRIRFD